MERKDEFTTEGTEDAESGAKERETGLRTQNRNPQRPACGRQAKALWMMNVNGTDESVP
jgi:hypothetical protein